MVFFILYCFPKTLIVRSSMVVLIPRACIELQIKKNCFLSGLLKSSTSYVYKPLQLQVQCLHGLLQSLDTCVFANQLLQTVCAYVSMTYSDQMLFH